MNGSGPQSYSIALSSGKRAGYYIGMLPPADAGYDYISAAISADDEERAAALSRGGFRFAERRIAFEIALRGFCPAMPLGKKFRAAVETDWQPEAVYAVAKDSFERDCRFALDVSGKDEALKNELLCGYIRQLRERGATATCLYQDDCLEGFNLWTMNAAVGQILLGAVSAKYRGTGVALALYSRTAVCMKEQRDDAVMRNIIASSNTASLNLHAMLARSAGGAFRLGPCWDYYGKEC